MERKDHVCYKATHMSSDILKCGLEKQLMLFPFSVHKNKFMMFFNQFIKKGIGNPCLEILKTFSDRQKLCLLSQTLTEGTNFWKKPLYGPSATVWGVHLVLLLWWRNKSPIRAKCCFLLTLGALPTIFEGMVSPLLRMWRSVPGSWTSTPHKA